MGNFQSDRLTQQPPFTYCGIGMSQSFPVKDGRKQRKYYSAMFTYMPRRAVHIKTANSMGTDSFILALKGLTSQSGNVRIIRTDN